MKIYRSLLTLLAAALMLPAGAQQTKVLTAEKHNEYGLVYNLPKTALQVTVTACKKTRIAGPYAKYAKKYIGTDRVISDNSEFWTVSDVKIVPYGVADTETQYLMQLKPGSTTYIGVADDGMLLSVNAEPVRTQLKDLSGSRLPESTPDCTEYLQYVDEDFLGSQSSAKQAEMLAASLLEVRDSYVQLTRGTADNMPTDGKQLELMLNSLKAQEDALTNAFTGVEYESVETRVYTYLPAENGREILFRLSDFAGFVAPDDYSGEPFYITTKIVREGTIPTDANGEEKKFPKDGVVYAIPGTAGITLSFKGSTLVKKEFEFAQFGTVFGLDPKLFTSRKEPSYAIFSDVTGGVLEIGTVQPE